MVSRDGGNKRYLRALFVVYAGIMLFFLFFRGSYNVSGSYWENIALNVNFVPLKTVDQMLYLLLHKTNTKLLPFAFVNLAGNIICFIPFGLLLPRLWERTGSFWCFLVCTLGTVAVIELLQLFTMRGICDIDDLLLNTVGALLGYIICKTAMSRQREK